MDAMFEDESGVAPEWYWLRPEDRGFVELLESVSGGVSNDDDDSVLGFIRFLAGRHSSPPFGVGQRDCSTGEEA